MAPPGGVTDEDGSDGVASRLGGAEADELRPEGAPERSGSLADDEDGAAAALAATLNDLGILHRNQNHMDDACKAFDEALRIRRQLAQKNPDRYLPALAETLNDLGILHRNQNHMDDAPKAFDEALKIRRQLSQYSPDRYLPALAETLSNFGILHRSQNRMGDARKDFEEALALYRRFAARDPDQYQSRVIQVWQLLEDLKGS
jgi:tetratricopeptide (TPR) repeat protein